MAVNKKLRVKVFRAQRVLFKAKHHTAWKCEISFHKSKAHAKRMKVSIFDLFFPVSDYICILFYQSNLCLCAENQRVGAVVSQVAITQLHCSFAWKCNYMWRHHSNPNNDVINRWSEMVMVNMSISLVVTGKNTENIIKSFPKTDDDRLFFLALCNLGGISQLGRLPTASQKLS